MVRPERFELEAFCGREPAAEILSLSKDRGTYGAPGEIRTPDLLLRRQSLYPAELRARTDKLVYRAAGKPSMPSYKVNAQEGPERFLAHLDSLQSARRHDKFSAVKEGLRKYSANSVRDRRRLLLRLARRDLHHGHHGPGHVHRLRHVPSSDELRLR